MEQPQNGLKPGITATIIALNEEEDLPRCLDSLSFANEIILIDSGSSDRTVEIAKAKGVRVITEPWHGYGAQKNFAMQHAKHEWVLNVDADEEITKALKEEILREIQKPQASPGFAVARKTFYLGQWIRYGGWYPNYVTRLVQKSKARWSEPHVHEQLLVEGAIQKLKNPMNHYTFRDIADQVRANMRYAKEGALNLHKRGKRGNLIKLLFKPFGKFLETYFFKRGCLDGLAGFIISINAAHSMFLKYAYLIELQRKPKS